MLSRSLLIPAYGHVQRSYRRPHLLTHHPCRVSARKAEIFAYLT
ncbi:hypothetical protein ABIB66_003057 [Bradyrhizobium sp. F1.13.3]